jgi:VPDSG-CTERM motif
MTNALMLASALLVARCRHYNINKYNNNPIMKRTLLYSTLCAVALALGSIAHASTLNFGDSRDLGEVLFGIPSGDQDRTDYVNHLVGMTPGTSDSFDGQNFTRSLNSCGACTPISVTGITNGTGTAVDLGSGGFLYLFAKYDGPNAGSEVWNIAGLSGVITIPAKGLPDSNNKYGLSGWSIWAGGGQHAPDAGATAALLGLGLAGLAGLRAKFGCH